MNRGQNQGRIIAGITILLFAAGIAVGQNMGQAASDSTDAAAANCARTVPFTFTSVSRDGQHTRETPIWQVPGSDAFFFLSGMTIDADGAPNAYHPDNIGLDDLINAGTPDHWDGIMTDGQGTPIVQGANDPYPGYYVSCTSLSDRTKAASDPNRYVDATKIPYIVLPRDVAQQGGARLGDFAYVVNLANGKSSYAIFADVGTMGEGSVALANNLGIWSDAREGGRRGGILYLVFPDSGNRQPRPIEEIQGETEKLLQGWGGMAKLTSCSANPQQPAVSTAVVKPPQENSPAPVAHPEN
jgi:hypothetical protein